ncbi:MAG: hypothetical protein RRX93_02860 [Bacteroidales bacterium]
MITGIGERAVKFVNTASISKLIGPSLTITISVGKRLCLGYAI